VLDTIVTIDAGSSFGQFFPVPTRDRKAGVEPEVLERAVALACSLAIEGREGRPLGTIFVVGDAKGVAPHVKQLVINPFRGYVAEHLNILDPSMEETIREFASIDGAFVIRGDGVILSAGTYLTPPPGTDVNVPGGLGTRHTAACALTAVTNAYAVVISQTAGTVTVFYNGEIFVVIERPERAVGVLSQG
jgi:DNA integrity scanning protein DisA with diadenylate cyclase activity